MLERNGNVYININKHKEKEGGGVEGENGGGREKGGGEKRGLKGGSDVKYEMEVLKADRMRSIKKGKKRRLID